MITLLHGDDIAKSRSALLVLKQLAKGKEIRHLSGKSITDDLLVQALSSSSLFGGDTVVVIENLFSGLGRKQKRIETLLHIITQEGAGAEVLLWEEKEVGKTVLSSIPKGSKVQLFKTPTIIFQFLDSVRPGRGRELVSLYRQLVEGEPAELIHALLVKRIRLLVELKEGHILQTIQPWQLNRLTNQARFFTIDRLLWLYRKLLQAEVDRNSGKAVFDFTETTERILIEL